MHIRAFLSPDQDQARAIVLEGLGEHFGFIDESLNPDLRDIDASYSRVGDVFLVAECDGELVGTAALRVESSERGRIVRMSVRQTHRRCGVAQALLARIIETARTRRLTELVVATEPHWHDAMGFYQAAGFMPYDRDDVDVHMRRWLRGD